MQKIGSLRSINPDNPFLGMWIALTRQPRWADHPLRSELHFRGQPSSPLYTIHNAWLTFEARPTPSLEPGKLADLNVLARDIVNCPLGAVRPTQVERPRLGGKVK